MQQLAVGIKKMIIFFRQNRRYFIIGLFVCLVVLVAIFSREIFQKDNDSKQNLNINVALPTEEIVIRRKINGQEVKSQDEANLYPVAIMVENSADCWPQTGLDKADLVIEAITEASIPRFVAFYANNEEIKKIGPVRSARPYYLDWIEPFAPLYLHVGGAPEALQKIRSGKYDLIDLDQFFWSEYYWRDKWRYAPHNVYTSSELIKEALTEKELTTPADYPTWKYKKDLEPEKRPEQVSDIKVNFSDQYYKVRWVYNREENNYIRYQYGDLHKMSDGEWIKAKNVIVQVNTMKVIDELGRKKIDTLGSGQAWIYRDGEKIEATWQKDSINDGLKYFDTNSNEIELNGGTTWIEVIPFSDYLRD
ncbi:MAG: DUF3048 domain-containing protein [Candidatus Parcubacteria bacterium]|nr:DUF3048 domain-containing protein [Candidatus Parcubacteria bacterium]